MTNEESILSGICPDCGALMQKWTRDEIDAAKADIGMGAADDFCDVCADCQKQYAPALVAA